MPADPCNPAAATPGRSCPLDYRYPPSVFDRRPERRAETLYVVGGLYGNVQALAAIEAMVLAERTPVTVVFNGDFHWFDADAQTFSVIEAGVGRHLALRGNVETELARSETIGAGCGCAYPDAVDVGTVERSNRILARLQAVADGLPGVRHRLAALPMHRVVQVGGARVAIVHGDAESLAGWRFAAPALDDAAAGDWLAEVRRQSGIDIFASTHTCLPVLRELHGPDGVWCVANNGAAGLPNFSGCRQGLLIRIGCSPGPHRPVSALRLGEVCIGLLPVQYHHEYWLACFDALWPAGSDAALSYRARIVDGPAWPVARALPRVRKLGDAPRTGADGA